MSENSVIYLSPSDDPEREWCQDDVWEDSVRYNLGTDFDAQRLRADTAEADLEQAGATYLNKNAECLQLRKDLAAAEQRTAILSKALTDIRENSEDLGACECAADALKDATLNPKPEAGSHE